MPLLFDDELHVHYSQFSVDSRRDDPSGGGPETCGGQANGLCGAAIPGLLFLTTGLHTGNVRLTLDLRDAAPPIGADWEEIVEVSFRPESDRVQLLQWAGEAAWPLALAPVDYRVRYCASGLDAARQHDRRLDGEPALDRYLLQFWPAPAAADEVRRQTSQCAAYWHGHARTLPPLTPEARAEAQRQQELARQELLREVAQRPGARKWGGRPGGRARRPG